MKYNVKVFHCHIETCKSITDTILYITKENGYIFYNIDISEYKCSKNKTNLEIYEKLINKKITLNETVKERLH